MSNVGRMIRTSLLAVWGGLLHWPGAAAMAEQRPAEAATEHTAWLAESLREMQSIKLGMTRADLLEVFQEAGGSSTRTQRQYAYRGCPYIKVDVTFKAVGAPDDRLTESPGDKITRISRPFLEGPVIDAFDRSESDATGSAKPGDGGPVAGRESSDARSDDGSSPDPVLQFITIRPVHLPEGVRLVQPIRTAPLIPVTRNPELLVDPKQIERIAAFFGMQDRRDLKTVGAAAVALYQENSPANEIGVYGLCFRGEQQAERWFAKLSSNAAEPPFLLKGALLLFVWKDDGVTESAFKAVRDHLKTAEFSEADQQPAGNAEEAKPDAG